MIQSLPSAGRQYVSNHLTTDRKDQAPDNRKPSLAAPPACRIISITDDPEPPFCRPPICLKSSDDGQSSLTCCGPLAVNARTRTKPPERPRIGPRIRPHLAMPAARDMLMVWRLDRLAQSLPHLIEGAAVAWFSRADQG